MSRGDWHTPLRFAEDRAGQRALIGLLGVIGLLTLWRIGVITHSGITLYVDEAYYWGWAQALDWGYFSKPPLIAGAIAATTAAWGDGLLGVKASSLILYPVTALLLFGLGRQLYDARVGALAGAAFLTLPITSALGLFASTDALLMCCWTAALWALHVALERQRLADWLLLGAVCGLGLMSKYTMAAFALTALLLLAGTPEGRRALRGPGPWLTALVALLMLAPNLWWNWANGFPTLRHTAEITQHAERPNPLEFIAAQFGAFGPLLALGFLGALAGLRMAGRNTADRLLIAGSLPLLLVVTLQSFRSEANANWAGPAFCGGTLLAVAWLTRGPTRQRLLAAALALNLAITALLYHWPAALALSGRPLSAKLDPLKRMKGWDTLARGIAPYIAAHPGAYVVADERTLLAHVAYSLRTVSPRIASWNPQGTIADQYQLTHSLPNRPGLDMLYLAKGKPAEIAARFRQATPLGTVRAQTHPDFALETTVWWMQGFKGY